MTCVRIICIFSPLQTGINGNLNQQDFFTSGDVFVEKMCILPFNIIVSTSCSLSEEQLAIPLFLWV